MAFFFKEIRVNNSKPMLSFDKLVEQVKSKGIIVNNELWLKKILSQINYQRLMVYRLHFTINNTIKPNTTIEDIYNLYLFDKKLKLCFFDILCDVEFIFRTKVSYYFGNKYGTHAYLDNVFFKEKFYHAEFMVRINRIIQKKQHKHPLMKFHNDHYTDLPPIYKIIELLSFGEVSKLFKNIKSEEVKNDIIKEFKDNNHKINIKVTESWLITLTDVRNICAHHDILWNRSFEIKSIKSAKWKKSIWKKNDNKEIFSILGILLILRDIIPDKALFVDFVNRVDELIQSNNILECHDLHFPNDWKEILIDK